MPEALARVGDIELCYETFGEPDRPALLVMGLGTQMVGWREDFCRALAGRGFHVIRYDNRDVGRSTPMDDLPVPTAWQLLRRDRRAAAYTLEDLAADGVGLLDTLGVERAHVVGASMGGMIAQTLAARHPERVLSLVSIMSNTGARRSDQPVVGTYRALLARPPRDREASGDRTPLLRTIAAPTLVIHGTGDRLVHPSGGRATAAAIPGARLLEIEGMGHDLPRAAWPRIIEAIAENAARAGDPPAASVRAA